MCHHKQCCIYCVVYTHILYFCFNDTATTEIYTLSLHCALPISFGENGDAVESLQLKFSEARSVDTSNFRTGDIVIVYPYSLGCVPNACAQMVNRASISDITEEGVEVVLRNSQTDRRVFDLSEDVRWAIEHDMFESSVKSLYSGIHSFLSASKERRDLLLCQREPTID